MITLLWLTTLLLVFCRRVLYRVCILRIEWNISVLLYLHCAIICALLSTSIGIVLSLNIRGVQSGRFCSDSVLILISILTRCAGVLGTRFWSDSRESVIIELTCTPNSGVGLHIDSGRIAHLILFTLLLSNKFTYSCNKDIVIKLRWD